MQLIRPLVVQGMRTVGPHVASKFCEIVKLRNRLARNLGYEDFYDYKVRPVYAIQDRLFFPLPCNRCCCPDL